MVRKRVPVPAALHAELSEYTSLIRALRTSKTLDVTHDILRHAAQRGEQGTKERDTWTRWPLPDFPVPEWQLDDEIKQLGEYTLRQLHDRNEEVREDEETSSDSDIDGLHPSTAELLVSNIGALLVHILNAVADQRPATIRSMQNRLFYMTWEDVIASIAVHGLVDQAVLSRAEKRLQQIYPSPDGANAIQKMGVVAAAKKKFAVLTSTYDDILLQPPQLRKRRRTQHVALETLDELSE